MEYFVSFVHSVNGKGGFGNTIVSTDKLLRTSVDFTAVEASIKSKLQAKHVQPVEFVILQNFQLLPDEPESAADAAK